MLVVSASPAAPGKAGDDQQAVETVLAGWIEAIGGKAQLRKLKSVDARYKFYLGDIGAPLDFRGVGLTDGRYRLEMQLPGGIRTVQAGDGKTAWQQHDLLGFGLLTEQENWRNARSTDPQAPLRVRRDYPHIRRLHDTVIDARELQVLELTNQSGESEKWFFSAITHLRVRIEREVPAGLSVLEYSEFRKTDGGVVEAFRADHTVAGQSFHFVVSRLDYNTPVDEAGFSAPAERLREHAETERILQRYLAACGGAGAVGGIKTRVTEILIENDSSGLKYTTTITQKRPDLIVSHEEIPGLGAQWQGYDGKIGWAWSELQGARTLQGAELAQFINGADLQAPLHLAAKCPLRRLAPARRDDERHLVGLKLATAQAPAGTYYFDPQSGHLVRVESVINAGPNGVLQVVIEFSDFRAIDGVTIPYVTSLLNPAAKVVTTIQSITQNQPVDDTVFQPHKEE